MVVLPFTIHVHAPVPSDLVSQTAPPPQSLLRVQLRKQFILPGSDTNGVGLAPRVVAPGGTSVGQSVPFAPKGTRGAHHWRITEVVFPVVMLNRTLAMN